MKAVIFNSGMGSRMSGHTRYKPKCMCELYNGETILERQLRILSECGIKEYVITTGPFKEQLYKVAEQFEELHIEFVHNPDYKKTNYIVSMNLAGNLLDDDVLLLHGDLVFSKTLVQKLLKYGKDSVCLYDETRSLPQKDFKGRFQNGILKEVSVDIFDSDCYAFQPLYKLSKDTIAIWRDKVSEYVNKGAVKVYAENALNEITDEIIIYGMSYQDEYIDEIDNEEDYKRVSQEIMLFDERNRGKDEDAI